MPHLLCQAIMGATTGLPKDRVINTFHFETGTELAPTIADHLQTFYDSWSEWISPAVSRGDGESFFVFYDMSDPEPRTPIYAQLMSLEDELSSSSLPLEVALCLSYRAEYASGGPSPRRRGRIYLGPWVGEAADMVGSYPRPQGTLLTTIAENASLLAGALEDDVANWKVYSRVDNVLRNVIGGWVDNEWDTQRRRGRAASNRINWATP